MTPAALASFLARRAGKAVLVVLGVVVLNFLLIRLAPGDPALVIAGQSGAADEKFVAQLRAQFGLDRPMLEQLWIYVSGIATGDLGISHRQQRTVASLILERLPATLLLTGAAFAFAVTLGVAMGAWAARRVGRWGDTVITVLALSFYATPLFWVGLMLVLLFSVQLEWLPSFGMSTVGANLTGAAAVLDVAKYLLLPALTLGLFYMAVYARLTRASMLEVADQDFVKTARAKGVPEARVQRAHVLRNALLPVITFAGIQAGQLVGGSILVETVFAWPGVGRLLVNAVASRDFAVVQTILVMVAVTMTVANLVVDAIYTLIDPRIRTGSGRA